MSVLLHMLPSGSLLNHRDFAWGNAELLSDTPLHYASGEQTAYLAYACFGEFGHAVFASAPTSREAVFNRVKLIVASVRPLKIFDAVVSLVTALVVHLVTAIRLRDEGERNEPVDRDGQHLAATRNGHARIAAVVDVLLQDPPLDETSRREAGRRNANVFARKRTNSPKVRDFVRLFVVYDGLPNLAHGGCVQCLS